MTLGAGGGEGVWAERVGGRLAVNLTDRSVHITCKPSLIDLYANRH